MCVPSMRARQAHVSELADTPQAKVLLVCAAVRTPPSSSVVRDYRVSVRQRGVTTLTGLFNVLFTHGSVDQFICHTLLKSILEV